MQSANFPKDAEGRTWHLAVKRGEICNRIIAVGDPSRAKIFASLFDDPEKTFVKISSRGFIVYTGRKNGVPVSILTTGMGFPMMDFAIREARAVVDGLMVVIRVGTCGCPNPNIEVGSVVVATKGACGILRNPNAFGDRKNEAPYLFLDVIESNRELSESLLDELKRGMVGASAVGGINASSDSFYCAQGRIDENFDDKNETLLRDLMERFPECNALEMESFHLLDLARVSKGSITATSCAIVCSNVAADKVFDWSKLPLIEKACGIAAFDVITQYEIEDSLVMRGGDLVW